MGVEYFDLGLEVVDLIFGIDGWLYVLELYKAT